MTKDLADALQWSRALLAIHGALSDAENMRVRVRLDKLGATLELARTSPTHGERRVNPKEADRWIEPSGVTG